MSHSPRRSNVEILSSSLAADYQFKKLEPEKAASKPKILPKKVQVESSSDDDSESLDEEIVRPVSKPVPKKVVPPVKSTNERKMLCKSTDIRRSFDRHFLPLLSAGRFVDFQRIVHRLSVERLSTFRRSSFASSRVEKPRSAVVARGDSELSNGRKSRHAAARRQ